MASMYSRLSSAWSSGERAAKRACAPCSVSKSRTAGTSSSSNGWVKRLFEEALTHSKTRKPGMPKDLVKEPAVFVLEYNDGLRAAAFLMTGLVEDFTVAVDVEGQPKPVSTLMYLQERRPHHHFGCLVKNIEMMFETGKAPYPVERTMLTSGILDFALESRIQGLQEARYARTRQGALSDA